MVVLPISVSNLKPTTLLLQHDGNCSISFHFGNVWLWCSQEMEYLGSDQYYKTYKMPRLEQRLCGWLGIGEQRCKRHHIY